MHVIPIAGGDPTSLCRFCFGFVVVVCFLPVFALLFLFAFLSVFLLGQLLDCVLVHYQHFCGFRQVDSPACKLQFNCLPRLNVCNDLAEAMKALDGKKRSALFSLQLETGEHPLGPGIFLIRQSRSLDLWGPNTVG